MTSAHTPAPRIVAIDLAREAHAYALVELLDLYARDPMGGGQPLSESSRHHLAERLARRADYFGFLALEGAQAVGLLNAFEGFSTFAAQPLMNIHDLMVHPQWRGHGFGHALLDAVETLARHRGCCKLTLEVLSNNRVARQAYHAAGFEAYQLDPEAGQAMFLQKWLHPRR